MLRILTENLRVKIPVLFVERLLCLGKHLVGVVGELLCPLRYRLLEILLLLLNLGVALFDRLFLGEVSLVPFGKFFCLGNLLLPFGFTYPFGLSAGCKRRILLILGLFEHCFVAFFLDSLLFGNLRFTVSLGLLVCRFLFLSSRFHLIYDTLRTTDLLYEFWRGLFYALHYLSGDFRHFLSPANCQVLNCWRL